MAFSSSAASLAAFILLPILTRMYSPEQFGILVIFQLLTALLGLLVIFRMELALPLIKGERASACEPMWGLIYFTGFVFCILFSMVFASSSVREILGLLSGLPSWAVYCLPFGIAFVSLNGILVSWFTRDQAFTALSLFSFAYIFSPLIFQVGFYLVTDVSQGLLWGLVIGQGLSVLLAFMFLVKSTPPVKIKRGEFIKFLVKYKVYATHTTPLTFLALVRDRSILFALNSSVAAAQVGFFNLARGLTNFPNTLVVGTLRQIFYSYGTSNTKNETAEMVHHLFFILCVFVFPGAVWAFLHIDYLLPKLFGQNWSPAAEMAKILMIPLLLNLLGNWMDRSFDIHGKQHVAFYLEFVFSIFIVILMFVAFYLDFEIIMIVKIFSVVSCIYYFIYFATVHILLGLSLTKIMRDVMPALFISIISLLLYFVVKNVLQQSQLISALVHIIIVFMICVLVISRSESFKFVRQQI